MAVKEVQLYRELRARLQSGYELLTAVENLFSSLEKVYRDAFFKIAKKYNEEYEDLIEFNIFLNEILEEPNEVTKYIFKNEIERKKYYLIEALRVKKIKIDKEIKKSTIRTGRMLSEYGKQIADKATLNKYKKQGIKKVQWIVTKDGRACEECEELNNKVFDIDKVPSKPHINCRCWLIAYK